MWLAKAFSALKRKEDAIVSENFVEVTIYAIHQIQFKYLQQFTKDHKQISLSTVASRSTFPCADNVLGKRS